MAGQTTYTQAAADAICELIADGKSLRDICLMKKMPSRATVFKWLNDNETFSNQYARAREEQAETLADEIIAIADYSENDVKIDKDGNERTDSEVVQRSRLRVDARKWVASKLKPKKYGDKIETNLNHTGNLELTINAEIVAGAKELLLQRLAKTNEPNTPNPK